jgi:predicted naringenin-chalcone synthase
MRHTHVQAIGTAVPRHRAPQAEVAEWAKRVARSQFEGDEREARRAAATIERVYRNSAIRSRGSVVGDYVAEAEDFGFYPPNWRLDPAPTTAERMEVYRREAPPLAREAAEACLARAPHVPRSAVSHLIVVTCTGFFAPGLDAALVKELGLRPDTKRTVVGFMGCYAAFNALRAADAVCGSDPEAAVLVVCVELCSIHFQREFTMNNVVANCLFSDGAAAALLTSEPEGSRRGAVEVVDTHTQIEEDTEAQMTWTVTDTGFQMALAPDVPDTLRRGVEPFVEALLGRNGVRRPEVAFWAVHPGGRRIVEVVRERLGLSEAAVAHSFGVLAEHGNMSSPTILFVLARCLERPRPPGELGVALAFGPGLTLESMLVRTV